MEYPRPTTEDLLRPIVTGWIGKIEKAREVKKEFNDVAQQCLGFFSGSVGFMWEGKFSAKYMSNSTSPRFRMTLSKAFELVALFGPVLYWRNPKRTVKPRDQLPLNPMLFGNVQQDQMAAQLFQQAQMEMQRKELEDQTRADLMQRYLEYTPNEQPDGGLSEHSEKAITEALVKGRGCLWTEPYRQPGSEVTLTGNFFDPVDNLFIDPDAKMLSDAQWIARRRIHPVWKVARDFDIPIEELEDKGSMESGESQGVGLGDESRWTDDRRRQGKSFDLITYYQVWSKGGVGTRLTEVDDSLGSSFDRVVGDYAYIVVSPDVPYPLNASVDRMRDADDREVQGMFQWPIPYWLDNRWPVTVLDFYNDPESAWPIAPLKPGLGELVFLNVIISHLCNRIWSSSRDFIAVLQSAAQEVEAKVKSGEDLSIIKLNEVHQDINRVVQFLQQPQVNFDAWRIIDRVMEIFDRRTGLTELLSGLNPGGTQSRSATDIGVKREQMSIRPDYMAGKVEKWQSECAKKEKFCARWFVEPKDVAALWGNVGATLWQNLVTTQPVEVVVREMDATVEAGSSRKPNHERDAQNVNAVLPTLLPEFSKHADITSDTGPFNRLVDLWGKVLEMDVRALQMGPRVPAPPPPHVQQQMQMQAAAQQQAQQMEMQQRAQEAQLKLQTEQMKQQGMQVKTQAEIQQAQLKQQSDQAKMQMDQAEAAQKMRAQQAIEQLKVQIQQRDAEMKARLAQQELSQDQQEHVQEMTQDQQRFELEMMQAQQQAQLQLQQALMARQMGVKSNGQHPQNTGGGSAQEQ